MGQTVKLSYVDQQHKSIDPEKTVYEVISGGADLIMLGNRQVNARAYVARFNFSGADQEKKCGMLSGGERNRLHLAIALKEQGNVLLLDLFNTLGLPTSTTVSMVFGLLGAAVAAALFRIAGNPGTSLQDLSQFINTGKAMVIIAAILLSVALAFVAGTLFMYISRLIFSFRYAPAFRRYGAVWCGISFAGIIYFALFKGLKLSLIHI